MWPLSACSLKVNNVCEEIYRHDDVCEALLLLTNETLAGNQGNSLQSIESVKYVWVCRSHRYYSHTPRSWNIHDSAWAEQAVS